MTYQKGFRSLRSLQPFWSTPSSAKTASFPRCYGPEFVAKGVRQWLAKPGTGTLYIKPGSPWENGYCESCNGKLRDECLNGEIFYSLREAQIVIEQWRAEYNTRRPHSRPATDRRRRQRSRRKWRLSGLLRPPARRQLHPCRRRL